MQFLYNIIAKKTRPMELALLLKKILFVKRRKLRIGNNFWYIDPVSDFGYRIINEGEYEKEMTDLILSNLSEGDVFVDLGANEGYFSILASRKVGKSGKILAIEPQERLWSIILKNIQLNDSYNIQLFPFAVGDKKEQIEFVLTPSINTGSSGLVKSNRNRLWKKQIAWSTTLDNIIVDTKIKLLKIDIEGYEFFALKGMAEKLKHGQIENIILEFHPDQLKQMGQSQEQIHNFLSDFGYHFEEGLYKRSIYSALIC